MIVFRRRKKIAIASKPGRSSAIATDTASHRVPHFRWLVSFTKSMLGNSFLLATFFRRLGQSIDFFFCPFEISLARSSCRARCLTGDAIHHLLRSRFEKPSYRFQRCHSSSANNQKFELDPLDSELRMTPWDGQNWTSASYLFISFAE